MRTQMERPTNVLALTLAALWLGRFQAGPPAEDFSSAVCHVAFARPAGWDVEKIESASGQERCWFETAPARSKQLPATPDDVDLYTITIVVSDEGLEEALPRSLFEREGLVWFALGRLGARTQAQPIKNAGWTGARGTKIIECFRKGGASAGPCEVPAAFIGTAQRSAELEGGPASGPAFDSVLQSIRFLP
jgi:hypothetical protein